MTDLAIKLSGVSKKYRYFTLDKIDLELPRGQIMGLIGANGAGKSTTIRILMGLVHQDSGEARVLGHRMPAEQVAAKWDIGFAHEFHSLDLFRLGRRLRAASAQTFWAAGVPDDQKPFPRPARQIGAASGPGAQTQTARA